MLFKPLSDQNGTKTPSWASRVWFLIVMFGTGTYVWLQISQNLAIPFWMIGHVHLSLNIYEDIHEILASCGLNIVVAIGFYLDYKKSLTSP